MAASPEVLVLDACVLIDYLDADDSVLRRVSEQVARIHVVEPVFQEVEDLTLQRAKRLRIEVSYPTLDLAREVANEPPGPLSFEDRICLRIAKMNGWICVTNDGALRKACRRDKVSTWWGLEMMAIAVERGVLDAREAAQVARAIHAGNAQITERVLERFLKRLGLSSTRTDR